MGHSIYNVISLCGSVSESSSYPEMSIDDEVSLILDHSSDRMFKMYLELLCCQDSDKSKKVYASLLRKSLAMKNQPSIVVEKLPM